MSSSGAPISNGGRARSCSPSTARPSRLVASTTTPGHSRSIRVTSRATAPSRCSQLSSTNRSCLLASISRSESSSDCPLLLVRRNAAATASTTPSGSRTGASSTSHAPSRYSGSTSAATCNAKRVLPTPPTPVIVTTRDVLSCRSDPRDTSAVASDERTDLCRKVSRERVQSPQRREVPTIPVTDQLEDPGGTAKVAQPVLTEVDELHSVGQLVAQEHLGGARDDGLPAMGGGHQARAPVDRQVRVTGVIDDHRLVGVQPEPCPQWVCGTPGLRRERLLKRRRRTYGISRRRERRGHSVAHPREHVTVVGGNRLLEQLVVADHRGLHRAGILLPHPGRALEIGEQKCHRARWWMPGHGLKLTSIHLRYWGFRQRCRAGTGRARARPRRRPA